MKSKQDETVRLCTEPGEDLSKKKTDFLRLRMHPLVGSNLCFAISWYTRLQASEHLKMSP